ncbi:MAG: hypothetical protein ABI740_06830 [Alphaproteobacteria bacterium]
MSLQECTQALLTTGKTSINAAEFSPSELEAAAAAANDAHALLFVFNLRGLTPVELRRIAQAGGRQIYFDDGRML